MKSKVFTGTQAYRLEIGDVIVINEPGLVTGLNEKKMDCGFIKKDDDLHHDCNDIALGGIKFTLLYYYKMNVNSKSDINELKKIVRVGNLINDDDTIVHLQILPNTQFTTNKIILSEPITVGKLLFNLNIETENENVELKYTGEQYVNILKNNYNNLYIRDELFLNEWKGNNKCYILELFDPHVAMPDDFTYCFNCNKFINDMKYDERCDCNKNLNVRKLELFKNSVVFVNKKTGKITVDKLKVFKPMSAVEFAILQSGKK